MEFDKIETLPPPPGVIQSLKAGFDAIASHITVIVLPLALDLLLWLGPRLRVDRLFRPFFDNFSSFARYSGLPTAELQTLQENSSQFLDLLQQYNLLSLLRTFPIGVFSLMSGLSPTKTPMGAPLAVHVGSGFTLLGWLALLTLSGWVIGGLFFRWVSIVVADSAQVGGKRFGQAVFQTILLSVMFFFVSMILGMPVFALLSLMSTLSPMIAQGMLLIMGLLSMWLIVPIFFIPHGIFMRQQNAFSSILTSLKMARFTLPTSSLFVLSLLLIGFGLNYLWSIPEPDNWMALIGITGHAFITTSLLAASFIYYRDMHDWLNTVLEKIKSKAPTQNA